MSESRKTRNLKMPGMLGREGTQAKLAYFASNRN